MEKAQKDLIAQVCKIRDEMLELNEMWHYNDDFLTTGYPFEASFDEMCARVMNWVSELEAYESEENK